MATNINEMKGKTPAKKQPTTIQGMLQDPRYKEQIAKALPNHITPERIARLAMTLVRKTPRLQQAEALSLYGAIIQCSQLGLEPGINAHLVPFKNNRKGIVEVQFIPDYRGLIKLVRNSGEIGQFSAHVVREGDFFEYQYGTDEYLRHIPADFAPENAPITHFYAIARSKDGSWSQFMVMSKAKVDAIRKRSKAADDGPWQTDYEAMGMKTVARQLTKWLPTSTDAQKAVQADEAADAGVSQQNRAVIDGDYEVQEEAPEQEGQPEQPQEQEPPAEQQPEQTGQQATGKPAPDQSDINME